MVFYFKLRLTAQRRSAASFRGGRCHDWHAGGPALARGDRASLGPGRAESDVASRILFDELGRRIAQSAITRRALRIRTFRASARTRVCAAAPKIASVCEREASARVRFLAHLVLMRTISR